VETEFWLRQSSVAAIVSRHTLDFAYPLPAHYKETNMNEHEIKLFELLLAEVFKNKIVLEELEADLFGGDTLLDIPAGVSLKNKLIGEYEKDDGKSFEYGPILFDESKINPSAIRENVLERKNDKRDKRR
jgi:hypothetical protein